jgi:hypothetical protein
MATFGATQVDESVRRIAACEEGGKRLPDELGQMVAALCRVGREAVDLACDDAVQRCCERPRSIAVWSL